MPWWFTLYLKFRTVHFGEFVSTSFFFICPRYFVSRFPTVLAGLFIHLRSASVLASRISGMVPRPRHATPDDSFIPFYTFSSIGGKIFLMADIYILSSLDGSQMP